MKRRPRVAKEAPKKPKPRLSKARAAFARELAEECDGRALGPTLTALLSIAPYTEHFRLFADETDAFDEGERSVRKELADHYGIIGLGRFSENHFGVIASRMGKTIDASPIGYVDRHGGDAAVAAADLATFLRIVHFFPDFLDLATVDADDADQSHAEFRQQLTRPEQARWDKLTSIPGVRPLASGKDVIALVRRAPAHVFAPPTTSDECLKAKASELFQERIGNSKLLVDIEDITFDDEEIALEIGVNASRDRVKLIVGHRVVQEPLAQFLVELRAAAPERTITVRYTPVPPEDRRDRDRSLRLALELAGARDLIKILGLA